MKPLRLVTTNDPLAAAAQMATLPANVRWKADNYNHLFEQPTVFYAVALAVLGEGSGINATLAWAYVATRLVHSLVQATSTRSKSASRCSRSRR